MPQFAKHNKKMKFYVSLIDFMSKEMWEHKSKQEYQAQAIQDSIVLENYLKLKNRKAQITEKGLMYNISKSGNNNKVLSGDTVWVNYTGRLLDGTIFDSNTDARYGHPEPFKFVVGKGNVIKGWDQGLVLFNEESEGQLYIPSGLAYGKRSSGPIPSNSCLIFDISIVQLKHEVNR
jgi:FKBP-type peptidyl-prolyl cis-trans isomerase